MRRFSLIALVAALLGVGLVAGPMTRQAASASTCPTPTNFRLTGTTDTSASFAWDASSGAVDYSLYFAVAPDQPANLYSGPFTGTTATAYSLQTTQTYNFAVRANCGTSSSSNSNVVTVTPGGSPPPATCAAPSNFRLTDTTPSTASFAWDPVSNAVDYSLYFAVSPEQPGYLYSGPFTGTTATAYGLSSSQTYNFAVRANCASHVSGNSNVVTVTPGSTTTTTTSTTTTTTTTTVPSSGTVCEIAPANSTVAVQAAIDSCPDGTSDTSRTTIRFPSNATYSLDGRLVLHKRQNIILDGRGSTFNALWPSDLSQKPNLLIFKARNLTVRNFTFVGNFNPDPALYPKRQVMSHYCEAQAGVSFYGGLNIAVEDSTARRNCGDGFGAYRSNAYSDNEGIPNEPMEIPTDLRMERLKTYSTARMCWGPTSGNRVKILNNYCQDAWYGVVDIETDVREEPVQNIEIAYNRAREFNIYGFLIPVGGPADADGLPLVRHIRIHDNVFETPPDNVCYPSVQIGAREYSSTLRFYDVKVSANSMVTMAAAVEFAHVDTGEVTDNTIDRLDLPEGNTTRQQVCGVPWSDDPVPVYTQDSTNILIARNTVT